MCFGQVRFEGQGALEADNGFLRLGLFLERPAQVCQCTHMLGLERKRASVGRRRISVPLRCL